MRFNTPSCRLCAQPVAPGTDLCEFHGSDAFRLAWQPQRRGYRDPVYARARRAAIRRAAGKCEACGRPLEKDAKGRWKCQAHHVNHDPADNAVSNLLICCPLCHAGSREPRP